jgi:hypothetical protein
MVYSTHGGCHKLWGNLNTHEDTCIFFLEDVQKGITEKVVPQLEKVVGVKLEGTVARQLQVQFHTVGKQALQVGYHFPE